MPRPQLSTKVRLEIKAYKKMYPKASLMEIAREFEPRIGRLVQKATISNVLKEPGGFDDQRINLILEKANDKMGQSIANKIARMGINRQESLAKATDLLNRILDREENVSMNDVVRVLSEITKIDQVLKGQPSEIHKIVKSIDDETLEFLASFKPATQDESNQPIPGEVVPDVPAVPGEFSEIGPSGEREAAEGGEDKILCPE